VVANSELKFYEVVDKYDKTLKVTVQPVSDSFLASRAAKQSFNGYEINKIITTSNLI
jgi:hypothetical protein